MRLDNENTFSRDTALANGARPLRVMFLQTDMRVGGAEILTANIIRRLNRTAFHRSSAA